eukprot:s698_g17.t1
MELQQVEEILDLDSLVTLQSDIVPYVLDWPVPGESAESCVLVVNVRPGGFLLAIPLGVIPEEVLAIGNESEPPGPVGPSRVVVVSAVIMEDGILSRTGTELSVLVVDIHESVLPQLHPVSAGVPALFAFDEEQPFAFPDPAELKIHVRDWLEAEGDVSGLGYVTAEAEINGEPTEESAEVTPRQPARRRKATAPGQEPGTPSGRKPTVASLAGSIEKLLQANVGISKQLETLALKQQQLEKQQSQPPVPSLPCRQSALRQPISSALTVPLSTSSSVLQQIGGPPRTFAPASPGLLKSPLIQQTELGELEAEKLRGGPSSSSDPLAAAVLAQSQALTALVSQIASQTSDPMVELGNLGASGTRGAQGRARLQADLASQKGLFFSSVLTAMARRMQPTAPVEGTPGELMARGICGTKYLERFGGFGKHRELGCLQFQVMSILDFLQTENWGAARDAAALLAVTLDQAALDNAKFDLALLLCLQEEPPVTIFSHRQQNPLSKTRAFSPLADQKWVTVALAYIKELDVISAKRVEVTGQTAAASFGSGSNEKPKAKATPKKKGKGAGKNNQTGGEGEEQ